MPEIKLRDYQQAAVDGMLTYWASGGGHGLIVLPTGAGKSIVAAVLIKRLVQEYGARVLLATHVAELVSQNSRALLSIWPDAPYGIYHAGLNKRDGKAPICFAGIHSIYKNPITRVGPREVILIDEAHLLSHTDDGMYRKLIAYMEHEVPGMRVGGLTATPYRLSTGLLTEDYGKHEALFSDVVSEISIKELIDRGYLCPVVSYASRDSIDISGVKKSGGDYNKRQLQEAVDKDDINARVVSEIIIAGRERNTRLVFASGVQHAEHLTKLLRDNGISAECVTGETPETERKKIFGQARSGNVKALVGANVMTTGLDIPNIDMIACVRPTQSRGLWVQMIGRGTRLSPETGKTNCLLLDFTDNTISHGNIADIDGSKSAPDAKGQAPVRVCPDCQHIHHAAQKSCPACNHKYPENDPKYHATASGASVFGEQGGKSGWAYVDWIRVKRHVGKSGSHSLRIDFMCGARIVSEWVPIESQKGLHLAHQWWKRNTRTGYEKDPPDTVSEALKRAQEIIVPGRILITDDGRYEKVIDRDTSIAPQNAMPIEVVTDNILELHK
jgi:DNA repair protein RadD